MNKVLFVAIAVIFPFAFPSIAKAGGVKIRNYGHSSLLIKGGGYSILLNPFKAVGCALGLSEPRVKANVILASSELADEGARVAKGIFLVKPGSYQIGKLRLDGVSAPHDRYGGRRYGMTTIWNWTQGGLRFAHLGGAAVPLSEEDKLLIGKPDVLIIAVGGGAKVFDGNEAANVVKDLKPKNVIPVQYSRGDKIKNCDQQGIKTFLDAMHEVKVRKSSKYLSLSKSNSDDMIIHIMK